MDEQTEQTQGNEEAQSLPEEYFNADGDFKSHGHFLKASGQLPANLPQGAPDPFAYPDDQGFRYEEDTNLWRQKEAVKQGMKEAMTPALRLDPRPDDENQSIKDEALAWEKECLEEAERSKRRGDLRGEQKWLDRAEFKNKDLKALGPSEREKAEAENKWQNSFRSVSQLGEAALDNSPVWNEPRMQHDAGVEIHRQNRDSRVKVLVLPKEKSPWGELEPIKPSNMVFVALPDEAYQRAINLIYGTGGPQDSDTLFKRTWQILRQLGYAQAARPTFEKAPHEETTGGNSPSPPKIPSAPPPIRPVGSSHVIDKDPDKMSQKEFEAMREKQGARRY